MLTRRMKWVGTPIAASEVKMCSLMRLLMTPLPLIVPRFCALNAVASSLKYWMSVPGSGPS
jgi:K+-transporting ATPase A subunit